jgi:predicted ATPase
VRSDEETTEAAEIPGSMPSIVESFAIDGLHGFQSISFTSKRAGTVLIARNGSGKTTLLKALDAFLKRQFHRLMDFRFDQIRCKFTDVDREFVLKRSDLEDFFVFPEDQDLSRVSQRIDVPEQVLYLFIVSEWNYSKQKTLLRDHELVNKLWRVFDYNHYKAEKWLNDAASRFIARKPSLTDLFSFLNESLSGFDIVYLPTYRRIEQALEREEDSLRARRRAGPTQAAGMPLPPEMRFGLPDIPDRLTELNREITFESGFGYRKLSANMIVDLVDGKIAIGSDEINSRPSNDDLKLFFSRLEASQKGPGPRYFDDLLPDLEKLEPALKRLENDDFAKEEDRRYLLYFLNQLGKVINSTKEKELAVDRFVSFCNRYLSSEHDTNELPGEAGLPRHHRLGGKLLKLNRFDLSVSVETVLGARTIPLDALSSGEKQIISLFARLYLYPGKKIILIDEPELSLSIDWQRSILVDALNAPLCRQVVAITHSPFVFDNELEPYARSINVKTSVGPSQEESQAD